MTACRGGILLNFEWEKIRVLLDNRSKNLGGDVRSIDCSPAAH